MFWQEVGNELFLEETKLRNLKEFLNTIENAIIILTNRFVLCTDNWKVTSCHIEEEINIIIWYENPLKTGD